MASLNLVSDIGRPDSAASSAHMGSSLNPYVLPETPPRPGSHVNPLVLPDTPPQAMVVNPGPKKMIFKGPPSSIVPYTRARGENDRLPPSTNGGLSVLAFVPWRRPTPSAARPRQRAILALEASLMSDRRAACPAPPAYAIPRGGGTGPASVQAARREEGQEFRSLNATCVVRRSEPVGGQRLVSWEPLQGRDLWVEGLGPSEQLALPGKDHTKCGVCHLVKSHPVSHCYVCIRFWLERKWTCPDHSPPAPSYPTQRNFSPAAAALISGHEDTACTATARQPRAWVYHDEHEPNEYICSARLLPSETHMRHEELHSDDSPNPVVRESYDTTTVDSSAAYDELILRSVRMRGLRDAEQIHTLMDQHGNVYWTVSDLPSDHYLSPRFRAQHETAMRDAIRGAQDTKPEYLGSVHDEWYNPATGSDRRGIKDVEPRIFPGEVYHERAACKGPDQDDDTALPGHRIEFLAGRVEHSSTIRKQDFGGVRGHVYFDQVNLDRYDVIIGTPFVNRHGAILDFGKQELRFPNGHSIPALPAMEEMALVADRNSRKREVHYGKNKVVVASPVV
ncbi:hypothetical protein B0H17DRAFT_1127680 [Mycena rosella]|uniref:Uncharacterized protein n=1 Tax=Mycena rosella TaxID=1033263 RepID=A0AAD7DZV8_MYCRO|nr:hypothetical protein B0H17DRAFT_1127680 [Mycena rosella]